MGIREEGKWKDFRVVRRLYRPMRALVARCGPPGTTKVRVRGKGSGYLEGGSEADIPLTVHLSCRGAGSFWRAKEEITALLCRLRKEALEYAERAGLSAEEVVSHRFEEHPRNPR